MAEVIFTGPTPPRPNPFAELGRGLGGGFSDAIKTELERRPGPWRWPTWQRRRAAARKTYEIRQPAAGFRPGDMLAYEEVVF